jgi:D-threo-aldose 1-dehydrogenase
VSTGCLIDLPRLALGCAPIGNLFTEVSEDDARATVDAAWDAGVRLFDTAPLYGHGLSERRLGEALVHRRRPDVVVSTKVGRLLVPDDPGGHPEPTIFRNVPAVHPVFDFSEDGVLRSIEASLERLGLDHVDVVHVHDPDDHADEALTGAFPVLRRLRDEGVISAVGAGMNQAAMLARFVREADVDCVLLAGRYSLLDQSGLDELLPLCERDGVGVIAAGVFNSGLLADPRPGATYDYAAAPPELVARARRLDEVCARHGVPLRAAALQFPLGHPAVRMVLVGARTAAEMTENAALNDLPIPAALWDDLVSAGLLSAEVPLPV